MRQVKRIILNAIYWLSPRWAQRLANVTEAVCEWQCPKCGFTVTEVAHVGGECAWERYEPLTGSTVQTQHFNVDLRKP